MAMRMTARLNMGIGPSTDGKITFSDIPHMPVSEGRAPDLSDRESKPLAIQSWHRKGAHRRQKPISDLVSGVRATFEGALVDRGRTSPVALPWRCLLSMLMPGAVRVGADRSDA
jgi:hypothetical protein